MAQQDRASSVDPSQWPLTAARYIALGVDTAFATGGDHSAMVVGGVWIEGARSIIGIREIVQFPTGYAADELADAIADTARKYDSPRVIFDSSNNSAFASILAARFPNRPSNNLVAGVITAGADHAAQPVAFNVSLLGQKTVLPRWTLSKRELIESVSAELDNGGLKLTKTGSWEALRDEFAVMERTINAAGTVRYSAPAGKHDDLILALSLCVFGLRRIGAPARRIARERGPKFTSAAWC
jgi:hypothetical protein